MQFPELKIDNSMPDDIAVVYHAGGMTYLNVKTSKSVTFAHPTVSELMERVYFVDHNWPMAEEK